MGVGDDGGQLEVEVLVKGDDGLAQLDHERARGILVRLVGQHRLEERVQRVEDVLEQHRLAHPDAHLERLLDLLCRVGRLDRLELRLGLGLLDEAVGLALRVNHERPTLGDRHDDAVFNREGVRRQAVDVPLAHLDRVGQDVGEGAVRCEPQTPRLHLAEPLADDLAAVAGCERAKVRDGPRAHQHIAHDVLELEGELRYLLLPRLGLTAQAADELVGVGQLHRRTRDLLLQHGHLFDRFLERRLERLHLLRHRVELGLGLLLAVRCCLQFDLSRSELPPLRLDLLGDVVVLAHRLHPKAHCLARHRHLDDDFGLELVRDADGFHQLDHRIGNVVLVEANESLLELVGAEVVEHLLGRAPIVVQLLLRVVRISDLDRLDLKHDAHGLQDQTHARRRVLERLNLDNLRLVQLGEALDGRVQRGQRLGEASLSRFLDARALGCLGGGGRRRGFCLPLNNQGLLLVDGDLRLLLLHLGRCLDEDGLLLRELLFEHGHLHLGLVELVEAVGQLVAPRVDLLLPLLQHNLDD
mmetsp:Transcript_36697/g.116811  ORF Transcript_36697/g.116811 Transcript_36697/m.116811 type:complete len:527 (-) Transcript_36697:3661-5241(-)|eukprot:scaffold5892_cov112-Isochrysis_galbana.AAC.18